jgi:hypothetical protein
MSIEITNWLRGLGPEQYASAFQDKAIDAEVRRELTANDLKDLGVNLVSHRRKVLAAITALRPDLRGSGTPIASTEPVRPGQDAGIGAERRQIDGLRHGDRRYVKRGVEPSPRGPRATTRRRRISMLCSIATLSLQVGWRFTRLPPSAKRGREKDFSRAELPFCAAETS